MYRPLLALSLCLFTLPLLAADWSLDNAQSNLSFVSIKKDKVGEVHHFTRLQGQIAASGKVRITIDLTSAATGIPIRDQRMGEFLFQTQLYPKAVLSADLGAQTLAGLALGQTTNLTVDATLDLHGKQRPIQLALTAVRLRADAILAFTRQPVILYASSFDLVAGIEKLRELAKLPSIAQAVPVSAVLVFQR